MDRHAQLRELFGLEFPPELFLFWDWYSVLTDAQKKTFGDGGMRPGGVCDVLAGKFDGVDLKYPAVLHWRYRYDLPELVTVLCGDTDGLHWGYWYDDPAATPVVVANYAKDAHEFWVAGDSLFDAIEDQIDKALEGCEENLEHDAGHADDYRREIAELKALLELVPPGPRQRGSRDGVIETCDRMGIVVPRATWDPVLAEEEIENEALLDVAIEWIDGGRPGVALYRAREVWTTDHDLACRIMERAYVALGREPLAAIARAHRAQPALRSVNVLDYRNGDFEDLASAMQDPLAVRKLVLGGLRSTEVPDLSALTRLEALELWGNELVDLPASLAACAALRTINVYRNKLSAFPRVLCELPALETAQLASNAIASIPDEICNCRALHDLDLGINQLSALPEAMGAMPALRTLNIGGNPLTALPASLGGCRTLRHLNLYGTQITALPPDLSGWSELETIGVGKCPLPAEEIERLAAAAPRARIDD